MFRVQGLEALAAGGQIRILEAGGLKPPEACLCDDGMDFCREDRWTGGVDGRQGPLSGYKAHDLPRCAPAGVAVHQRWDHLGLRSPGSA